MRFWGSYFLSICFCIYSTSIFSQFSNLKFENLDTSDGLSSSTCLQIHQDNDGFLWFGTIDGLNKFNGYEFEVFRSILKDSTSISNNRINAITEDNLGNLWVGTNNGLNRFNKKTNNFWRIDLYKNISFSSNPRRIINDLLFDHNLNVLWVATDNGVIKIGEVKNATSIDELTFSYYMNNGNNELSIDNNNVNSIVKDAHNAIWLVTNGENLNRYNAEQDVFERIPIKNTRPYKLDHIHKLLFVDAEDDFWIGNDLSNLILWDKKGNNFNHVAFTKASIPISDIYQNKNGLFWIATDGHGLFQFDKETRKLQQHIQHHFADPFSIPNNKPSKIYEDTNGVLWIGSYDKGVSILDPSKYSFGHYYFRPNNPNGLSEKIAQSVLQDSKGNIWIGAYNGGLNFFNEEKNSFKNYGHRSNDDSSLSSNKILYTFEASDGAIWVCTLDGGLDKFDPKTKKFEHFKHSTTDTTSIGQNSVWTGVEDAQKRLWFGLRTEGLSLYDHKSDRFYNFKNSVLKDNGLASNFVFSMMVDSKNRLLIGTSQGLNYVDLNKLTEYIPKDLKFSEVREIGIEGNNINYITEDHKGNTWLGTDSGIYKLDDGLNLMRSYTSQDGLPNNFVVGLKEDDQHNFWVTSKSGLSLLNPVNHKIRNFNIHDGLQGTEFQSKSIAKTKDGRILAGGINGFNIFNPKDISAKEPVSLAPQITNLKLYNKKITVGDTINNRVLLKKPIHLTENLELKHKENYISFEFLALYFENPELVRYAYKMNGLDDNFVKAGDNREVNYSNLPPGDYVFEVKAAINDQWEKAEATKVSFSISPPFWSTWWAYLFYVVFGVALFWLGSKYYRIYVQETQRNELDQTKLQFFVNVSHEFRTPLTLILNPVDKILANTYTDPELIKESALSIQRSSRRLLHLINQLLDYRKMDVGMAPLQLEKGDIVTFSEDIFSLFKGLAAKKHINYSFHTTQKKITSLFDFDKLEKIVTNLISNAIKFTSESGEIKVKLNKVTKEKNKKSFSIFKKKAYGKFLEIVIEDTGIGFSKEQLKTVFSRFHNMDITKSGTGIGLNFTKALVEQHGGEIWVESEPKKGSKFIVTIPLDIKAKPDIVENTKNEFLINSMKAVEYEMSIANNETAEKVIPVKIGDKNLPTILLVEDNKELRVHLRNDLKRRYIVKEAVNGAEGLKMVKKHYPDLVVSDVMMPMMDGFNMCKAIKTEFETSHIPVLLLTARTFEDDRIAGYDNGADAYLAKPFKTDVLLSRIKNLLEAKNRIRNRYAEIGGVFPSSEVTTNNLDEVFLDKATKVIVKNISDVDFKQEHLLKEMGIGRSQFYRKINAITGHNPSYFIRTIRLRYASELLQQNRYSIKEITHMCGFNSTAYFSKTFRELFKLTPTEYMEQNKKPNEILES